MNRNLPTQPVAKGTPFYEKKGHYEVEGTWGRDGRVGYWEWEYFDNHIPDGYNSSHVMIYYIVKK